MRQSLLPRTLEAVADNLRYHKSFRVFELSRVYLKKDEGHEERSTFIAAVTGGQECEDFRVLQGISEGWGLPLRPAQEPLPYQHPGRNADIMMGDVAVGKLYEVHPQILKNFDIKERTAVMELDVEIFHEMDMEYHPKYRELPKFPAVTLDISLMIPRKNLAGDYLSVIQKTDPLVRGVRLIDQYDGKELGSDKRALTYSITYLADDRTLTDAEVEKVHEQVLARLKEQGAEIR